MLLSWYYAYPVCSFLAFILLPVASPELHRSLTNHRQQFYIAMIWPVYLYGVIKKYLVSCAVYTPRAAACCLVGALVFAPIGVCDHLNAHILEHRILKRSCSCVRSGTPVKACMQNNPNCFVVHICRNKATIEEIDHAIIHALKQHRGVGLAYASTYDSEDPVVYGNTLKLLTQAHKQALTLQKCPITPPT